MKNKLKFWLVAILITIPSVYVLNAALITCGIAPGDYCTFCDLIALIQNIINLFIRSIIWYIALFYLMYAGFLMIVGKKVDGIKIIKRVLIGLVIILLAWAIVNSLIYVLAPAATDENGNALSKSWNRINCEEPTTQTEEENINN